MPTVLIAAPAHLGVLKQRGEFKDALAFADNDALRAFAAIARQRAEVVVIDSSFAATSRGVAFINRIKADPALSGCDVRVLNRDEESADAAGAVGPEPSTTPPVAHAAPEASAVPAPPTSASPETPPASGAVAFESIKGVELLVDGSPATLVDLSTGGAQVMSQSSLKPNQRVRLTLPGSPPVRLNGSITWAMFEMPGGVPRYRAGVTFVDPDTAGIAAFINANR